MARVLVPLAPGCEELEAVTIVDLLRRAELEVVTAALQDRTVVASRKTVLVADSDIETEQKHVFDLVVLPGGLPGADHLAADERVIKVLRKTFSQGGMVAAICAAPKVLVQAGLLESVCATAYPGVLDSLRQEVGQVTDANVEVDGRIITSKGPATAIEFALTLIELLVGKDKKQQVDMALRGVQEPR